MSKFNASAAAVGHMHQVRWAMYELLRAGRKDKSIRASLESYDDIALLREDGTIETAQQLKHHGGPATLTDGSEDLWKTLRVWLSTPHLKDETGPKLFLLTTASASKNSAVSLLTPANYDPETAALRLTELAESLDAQATKTARELWLSATPSERLAVLRRVSITANAPHAADTDQLLREELATAVRDKHVDIVLERLWGWWQQVALKVLQADRVETISADMLYKKLYEILDDFRGDALPLDPSLVEVDDADLEEYRSKPFVQQLDWIGVHSNNLRRAMVNYHRAYTQTAKWVRDGDLVESDLTSFESELREEWEIQFENMCDRLELDGALSDTSKLRAGRELFDRMYDVNTVRIRAALTEPFLANGSRHMLADRGHVGWHPDFKVMMAELLGVAA